MMYNELEKKLIDKINRIGIISRAWDDKEISKILKGLKNEVLLNQDDDTAMSMTKKANAESLANVPSIRFYNLHLPAELIPYVYKPSQMVEYAIKNQKSLSKDELDFIGLEIIDSYDKDALLKFIINVKKIDKEFYVTSVVRGKDATIMADLLPHVSANDFEKLTKAILQSNDAEAIYRLTRYRRVDIHEIIKSLERTKHVGYMFRICEMKDSHNNYVLNKDERSYYINKIIDLVTDLDFHKVVDYVNSFTQAYARLIAQKFIEKNKDPKTCMKFAMITGYCREDATSIVAESGDVESICDVLDILAKRENEKSQYLKNISVDELIAGLTHSKIEDLIANSDRILNLISVLKPRIKRMSLLSKLYSYIGNEATADEQGNN